MPLIQVSMARGRTDEQKKVMLAAITCAVHEAIGAPVATIRVWVNEFGPSDFMAGGQLLGERAPVVEVSLTDDSEPAGSAAGNGRSAQPS